MLILPAIDLLAGEVVRLKQGDPNQKTVYSSDPVAFARRWEAEGGDYLHVVDLDGAFTGQPTNLDHVRAIAAALSIPIELGGGIRTIDAAKAALDAGVSRVIVGTRAAESVEFVKELIDAVGADRVAIGIDARKGIVAVKGWTETGRTDAIALARTLQEAGARTLIYTDIATDGMLEGPNIAELKRMCDAVSCDVVASGGISAAEDVRRIGKETRAVGVVIGKALFDGRLTLADAVAAAS